MEPQGSSEYLHVIEYLNADHMGTSAIYRHNKVINSLLQ
jgi:hypothetical protein